MTTSLPSIAIAPDRMAPGPALPAPAFFAPNRVWRCYRGGLLLDRFLGRESDVDGHLPEEWLASTTAAENGERSLGPHEGLSRIRLADGTAGPLLRDALGDERIAVLCKFLDSAVRLPIQCHPDRAFARAHYGSEHGKTESWLILDTRIIDGEEPYVLIGFQPGVAAADFARAVESQDIEAMVAMLHRIPVKSGDAFLIPGRVPHAIGPGVLMLEVQEPSDWVVQVERSCAGTPLSDRDRWGPLDPATAMACFDYGSEPMAVLRERLAMRPREIARTVACTHERLQATATTDAFRIDRLRMRAAFSFVPDVPRHIGIVTDGSGCVAIAGRTTPLVRGDAFLVPSGIARVDYHPDPDHGLTVHVIAGPTLRQDAP